LPGSPTTLQPTYVFKKWWCGQLRHVLCTFVSPPAFQRHDVVDLQGLVVGVHETEGLSGQPEGARAKEPRTGYELDQVVKHGLVCSAVPLSTASAGLHAGSS
jgi:hypothetical protein